MGEIIDVLKEAGVPYDPLDEDSTRAAYAKLTAAIAKRQRVAR